MFALLDARGASRRALTTSLSLGAEAAAVAALIVAPLLYTSALPNLHRAQIVSTPQRLGSVAIVSRTPEGARAPHPNDGLAVPLRQPRFIPNGVHAADPEAAPPALQVGAHDG